MTATYYEKLRSVYEQHLDKKIKGKKFFEMPSPTDIMTPQFIEEPPKPQQQNIQSHSQPVLNSTPTSYQHIQNRKVFSSKGAFSPIGSTDRSKGILSNREKKSPINQLSKKSVRFKEYNARGISDIQKMRIIKEYELELMQKEQKERSVSRDKSLQRSNNSSFRQSQVIQKTQHNELTQVQENISERSIVNLKESMLSRRSQGSIASQKTQVNRISSPIKEQKEEEHEISQRKVLSEDQNKDHQNFAESKPILSDMSSVQQIPTSQQNQFSSMLQNLMRKNSSSFNYQFPQQNSKRSGASSSFHDVPQNISKKVADELKKQFGLISRNDQQNEHILQHEQRLFSSDEKLVTYRDQETDEQQVNTKSIGSSSSSSPYYSERQKDSSEKKSKVLINQREGKYNKILNQNSSKEIIENRYISKNKSLIASQGQNNATLTSEKTMSRDLIHKIEELQKSNIKKIQTKRTLALQIISNIVDQHRMIDFLRELRSLKDSMNFQFIEVQKLHKKNVQRKFIQKWKEAFEDKEFEQQNLLKAKKFHEGQMAVRMKVLLAKMRKVIKDEQKWMKKVQQNLRLSTLRRLFDNHRLLVKYQKIKRLHKIRVQKDVLNQFKHEEKNKDYYLKWHLNRIKKNIITKYCQYLQQKKYNNWEAENLKSIHKQRRIQNAYNKWKQFIEDVKYINHDILLIKGMDEEFFNVQIGKTSTIDYNHKKFINVNKGKVIQIAIQD